jgi:outer membrane protein assembly factor BamA
LSLIFSIKTSAQSNYTLINIEKTDLSNKKFKSNKVHPYPSQFDSTLYEINQITFSGNQSFSSLELMKVINNRTSERSFVRDIFEMYYNQGKRNIAAPKTILNTLEKNIISLEFELRYFDNLSVETDIESIKNFYNQTGWHLSEVDYEFYGDKTTKSNVLNFKIKENQRFKIGQLIYVGLDNLTEDIKSKIENVKIINRVNNENFNEYKILDEISKINDVLQNNGYYFAKPTLPNVVIDTVNCLDSISIKFDIGNRYKIGNILYKDYLHNQNPLAYKFKQKFVNFKEDEWYSRDKISQTQRNLLGLHLFEKIKIDTLQIDYDSEINSNSGKSNNKLENDSIIHLKIVTDYAKQQDWGVSPFYNKTAFDQLTNLGLEGSYSHKNWWGAAQNFQIFSNVSIKDVDRSINSWLVSELVYQVGFKYSQPLLWVLGNSKVGFSTSPTFAKRTINNLININSVLLPIRFPVSLPNQTYFNQILLDFDFERQQPADDFGGFDTLNNETAQLRQFVNLKAYTDTQSPYSLTSNILGITFLGDRRNSPFEPTEGYYTNISIDGWNFILGHSILEGLSKYYRFQFSHYQFVKSDDHAVWAFKGRLGATYTFNYENNYIPIEKQFFAGGANSVRGWESRRLRYTNLSSSDLSDNYRIFQDFAGSKTIIEGSIEYRYKIKRPEIRNDFLADMIAKCGFTFFLDFGNAFGWYIDEDLTKVNYYDYLTKLAVATGVGFRFDTPVGPFRIDFALPIQGPIENKPDLIFNRYSALSDYRIHLGLGHAF